MKRREFIAGLLFAATAQRARAQKPEQLRRIAFVHPSMPVAELRANPYYRAVFEELGRLGYVEGRNLTVELLSGEGKKEHFAELARDVVRLKPDVILTASCPWPRLSNRRPAPSPLLR